MVEEAARPLEALPPAVTAAQPGEARDPLFSKLAALTLFRLAIVTVLLGGTAFAVWSSPGMMGQAAAPLFRLVLLTYLVSLAFAVWLRRRAALQALAYAQIAVDVGIAAAVVAFTGSSESVFVFMFLLAIVNGSILLFRRGAISAAALSVAAYAGMATLGATSPPNGSTLFAHAGAFVATAALASYLSEQLRRTGERLEEREVDLAAITALHEAIVQSVASGLVTLDGAGRITFLNKAGEQITGLGLAEVRGEPAERWFSGLRPQGGRDEADFVSARGERLRLGYTLFPLIERGGRGIGSAIIFQDLSQLRAMEKQVRRSERLADLGRVAAGLAHELRNPLASMVGSIELLKGCPALSAADTRLMDIVLREAGRLEQLVAAFLAFSKPATPRRERVEVDRALADTLEVFANDPAAARVKLERSLEPVAAWCDPDQIRQVFWNLLANAAHASGAGEVQGTVRVACGAEEGAARFSVEDDGPGIAASELTQIFTPFFTTKDRGTGLGLATVQRIVDAHGGTVSVQSTPGNGSRFTVRLPQAAPPATG